MSPCFIRVAMKQAVAKSFGISVNQLPSPRPVQVWHWKLPRFLTPNQPRLLMIFNQTLAQNSGACASNKGSNPTNY